MAELKDEEAERRRM